MHGLFVCMFVCFFFVVVFYVEILVFTVCRILLSVQTKSMNEENRMDFQRAFDFCQRIVSEPIPDYLEEEIEEGFDIGATARDLRVILVIADVIIINIITSIIIIIITIVVLTNPSLTTWRMRKRKALTSVLLLVT